MIPFDFNPLGIDGKGYAKTPQLWIEADSWGRSTWKNKGNGGYNLDVYGNSYAGTVSGKAIVSPFRAKTERNVVGTGSFTIEAVVLWNATSNANFLICQREKTTSPVPDGSMQIAYTSSGWLGFYLYHPDGENMVTYEVGDPKVIDGEIQYIMCRWDAENGNYTKQINDNAVTRNATGFSCSDNTFGLGYAYFNGGNRFSGSLYSLRIYQRALSDAEAANNQALDRKRFPFA
jgi:hypothetical protein